MTRSFPSVFVTGIAAMFLSQGAAAQVTRADYERALQWRDKVQPGVLHMPEAATWVGTTHRFVYRRTVSGGHEFVMMDADTKQRRPPFDHARLAAAINKADGGKATAVTLPFSEFRFTENEKAIEFTVQPARWTCALADYTCTKAVRPVPPGALRGVNGPVRGAFDPKPTDPKPSPDGRWVAFIQNYNVAVKSKDEGKPIVLSNDGSEGDAYELESIVWSPDSSRLAAYRVRPGYQRFVHYVESSPEDQLQPRHWTLQYAKPRDVLDREHLAIFHVEPAKQVEVSHELMPNPYELSAPYGARTAAP